MLAHVTRSHDDAVRVNDVRHSCVWPAETDEEEVLLLFFLFSLAVCQTKGVKIILVYCHIELRQFVEWSLCYCD